MTQETQTQQVEQQEPIFISLNLTIEQVNFILNALGKMPTESGAWVVTQIVGSQAQEQFDVIQSETAKTEEKPTVQ